MTVCVCVGVRVRERDEWVFARASPTVTYSTDVTKQTERREGCRC